MPNTGDMRLVLNKAGAAQTASVVFQTGWSGRAEFGLSGDEDWRVKVSHDGVAWYPAFDVGRFSGKTTFRQQLTIDGANFLLNGDIWTTAQITVAADNSWGQ
ncbi:MAG: hypothetical protein K8H74_15255 [Notoacmeibacter sp.]|nr:hypothetical protein [Notoacmeibacter sp.]